MAISFPSQVSKIWNFTSKKSQINLQVQGSEKQKNNKNIQLYKKSLWNDKYLFYLFKCRRHLKDNVSHKCEQMFYILQKKISTKMQMFSVSSLSY